MALFSKKPAATSTSEQIIVSQIDALESLAKKKREDVLGVGWEKDAKEFYELTYDSSTTASPAFRPQVRIPELQMLLLNEASDLSENNPRIYLATEEAGRDRAREKALQAKWKQDKLNLEILYASLWSLICGTGFLQIGWDSDARRGRGDVWVKARMPEFVFPDPNATSDENLSYVIFHDYVYIDNVRRAYPKDGYRVRVRGGMPPGEEHTSTLRLPDGPMQGMGGLPYANTTTGDGRVRVRRLFVRDFSTQRVEGKRPESLDKSLAFPEFMPKYPNGRLIVECEGVILFDGTNPFPQGRFPLISISALPPLTGYWCPTPRRYTEGLQKLSERMFTQVYENAYRLNNGVTYIQENTGIDIEDFGGIPAEVHKIASGSQPPQTVWPNPMPQSMIELPMGLLRMQREVQGFTENRKGGSPAGNVSAPLFDASVAQSMPITRLRSRLLASGIENLAKMYFATIAEFYKTKTVFMTHGGESGVERVVWEPLEKYDDYSVILDPGSVKAISSSALRNLIPVLKQMGIIDSKTAVEWLELPQAEDIVMRLEREMQMRAAAGIEKGLKGKK